MHSVRSRTIALLAAGMLSTALLSTTVHAESGDQRESRAGGMGMMQEGGSMMDRGEGMGQMGQMGQGGMMQRCPMMGERQGMMQGEGSMGMMGGMMMGGMQQMHQAMHELDLSDEQRSELIALRHDHREAQFERMARMMNQREDLHALMASEQPDPEQVQEQHGRVAEIHGEMLAEQARFRNAMGEVLTEEQRQQLQMRPSAGNESEPSEEEDHEAHH